MKKSIALVAFLLLTGCSSTPPPPRPLDRPPIVAGEIHLDYGRRLLAHPDYAKARECAPDLVKAALEYIAHLELLVENQPLK